MSEQRSEKYIRTIQGVSSVFSGNPPMHFQSLIQWLRETFYHPVGLIQIGALQDKAQSSEDNGRLPIWAVGFID